MSATMRAARLHAWNEAPVVEDVPVPGRAPGESLIKVDIGAVSHLDVTVASGTFGIRPDLPHIGGVEGCGVVVESETLTPGTRVILRGGGIGLVRPGTWAELVSVKDKTLVGLPEGLTPAQGATFWVPTTTAHAALHAVGAIGAWRDEISSPAEERVIVAGAAGAVGSLVVQLALRTGAAVTALVADASQETRVPAGAAIVRSDDTAATEDLAERREATMLVDTIGGSDLVRRSRWVRPGGRAVLIGYVAGNDVSIDLSNWLLDDVALLPVNMMRRERAARGLIPELASLLAAGKLTLDHEVFTLDELANALEMLRTGRVRGRAVVQPG